MQSFSRFKLLLCSAVAVFVLISVSAARPAHSAGGAGSTESWDALVDEFFDQAYFKFSPSAGTSAGLHQYDSALEDYSAAGVRQNVEVLRHFEKRFEEFDPKGLDETRAADRQIVLSDIRASLLSLQTIRPWEKNPDTYSSGVTESIYVIMSRRYASTDERLRSAIARETQIPAALAAARQNLKNPPHIFTEIALEQLPDTIAFFQNDVPAAFADAKDAKLQYQFQGTNAAVIDALKSYADWLRSDLLPHSNGDFRLGPETFSKKLQYEEMVDTPIDALVEMGGADLRKNQAEFAASRRKRIPARRPARFSTSCRPITPLPIVFSRRSATPSMA